MTSNPITFSNQNPIPGGLIQNNKFDLIVSCEQVVLNSIVLTVNGETTFSHNRFYGSFASSSFSPVPNGYNFSISKSGNLQPENTISVIVGTSNGESFTKAYQLKANTLVQYPVIPLNGQLGSTPLKSFTGEGGPRVLSGAAGIGFFSPSLDQQPGNSEIDIRSFEVSSNPSDTYTMSPGSNRRPWLWGPAPAVPPVNPPPFPPVYSALYEPILNAEFCFLKTTQRSAIGIMTDIFTLESTIIIY